MTFGERHFERGSAMKKVILIPDSFKGTLSSQEVCAVMEATIGARFPQAEVLSIPVADGGEGSVDAFLTALGGQKVFVPVCGPLGEEIQGFYGLLPGGGRAVIEMACCAGLPLVEGRKDPRRTTTYGVGQLILAALDQGVTEIYLGLGGSATNDGGCGGAAALGITFFDEKGEAFVPTGGTLGRIARIDTGGLTPLLQGVSLTVMCDITNPLYGETGAAFVFGPQKGADDACLRELDEGLRHLAAVIRRDLGVDVSTLPGGGAAGGMGAGMAAFLGAALTPGIQVVLEAVGFDGALQGADVVFTGEGRIDSQSLGGKAVIGVSRRAKKAGVPVIAVVGCMGQGFEGAYQEGVSAIFSINPRPEDFEEVRHHAGENLALTMENILRLWEISAFRQKNIRFD